MVLGLGRLKTIVSHLGTVNRVAQRSGSDALSDVSDTSRSSGPSQARPREDEKDKDKYKTGRDAASPRPQASSRPAQQRSRKEIQSVCGSRKVVVRGVEVVIVSWVSPRNVLKKAERAKPCFAYSQICEKLTQFPIPDDLAGSAAGSLRACRHQPPVVVHRLTRSHSARLRFPP